VIFKEFGDKALPTIILLHGGGLSWWAFTDIIPILKQKYHVVTPIIDGHGDDGKTTFISIEESAQRLIQYIDTNLKGNVHALCGLSLGAQIIIEVLSRRVDITKYVIIESAMVIPPGSLTRLLAKSSGMFYGLIRYKWFAKLQAKALYINDNLFDRYFNDSKNMSKESLVNISLSNAVYTIPDQLKDSEARVMIVFGGRELKVMDQSARKLISILPQAQMCICPGMKHGELSLARSEEYLALINGFIK
jgi:pimeloyl-ACP methyl ester carboxylesterase